MRITYTKQQYIETKKLYSKGMKMYKIAKELNIKYDTVKGWIRRGRKPATIYYNSIKAKNVAISMGKKNTINYSIPKLNDERFAYIIGVLLSDGNLNKQTFRLSVTDEEFAREVQKNLNSLFNVNLDLKKQKAQKNWKSQYVVKFSSIIITSYLTKTCYKNNKKRVPQYYLTTRNKDLIWSLIQGMYDGDGSIYSRWRNQNKKYKHFIISLVTEHKELSEDIQTLLKNVNVKSRIDKDRTYYKLVINGEKNVRALQPFFFRLTRKKMKEL